MIRIVSKLLRKALPKSVESLLVFQAFLTAVEKARFLFACVKRKARCFVKIKHHIKAAALACVNCPPDPFDAIIHQFRDIVVHREPHMIDAPRCYGLNILIRDESVESFKAIVTLRHPASEIHSFIKAFFFEHFIRLLPLLFLPLPLLSPQAEARHPPA